MRDLRLAFRALRLALGAARARVVRLVLVRIAVLTAAGVIAGTAASGWASRFVSTLLFGVQPGDLGTQASAAAGLAVVAFGGRVRPCIPRREHRSGESPAGNLM